MTQHPSGLRANRFDRAVAGTYEAREADWRNGAVVYQVLVDRFAPSANLDAKRHLYPAPKRLMAWDELPLPGPFLPEANVWSQEVEFWGGDLASTTAHLDHVQQLGVDVLYLNPIHAAYTNHKYDALDFLQVSPEFGSREDVAALAAELHQRGMKLVLDGVFNHMGRNAPIFQDALNNPASPYREWFHLDPALPAGARVWTGAPNLPELNMEHPAVREHLYAGRNSAVRSLLREGVDGWRLDVAHDIGFNLLEDLTRHAHEEKPGSLVVGELWTYPQEWFPCVDGVMNMAFRELIVRLAQRKLAPQAAARMISRVIADAGLDNLLKSWLMLDNHDTVRLATAVPDPTLRRLAQLLQFTLPGAPNIYYGSELGMAGGADPEMRAPMRWDLATDANADLAWHRRLVGLRREHRALRVGDFRLIESDQLLAFERYTDRIADSVFVIVNPGSETVTETVMVPNSKLMTNSPIDNLLAPEVTIAPAIAAMLELTLPPGGMLLLKPHTDPVDGYTTYKRVQ
jgi:cyclomaltodextrinase / maltogenic alpha-amylase / neopullulanase